MLRHVTVLAGGPGTGKTTTVARLLALLAEQPGPPPRIALAAPTGKAAARLQEAVTAELPARFAASGAPRPPPCTGCWAGGRGGTFRYDRAERLPYDVVVVDETSMVSLPMMARLLDAVRPQARLVLVGDPDQLASVEAGAVLGDLTRAERAARARARRRARRGSGLPTGVVNGVVTLDHVWRFDGAIAAFARAVQAGDADTAVELLRVGSARSAARPAPTRSPALQRGRRRGRIRTRRGRGGGPGRGRAGRAGAPPGAVRAPARSVRGGPVDRRGRALARPDPRRSEDGPWYPGRAVLVTANDYDTGLFNGDTGVVVDRPRTGRGSRSPAAAHRRSTRRPGWATPRACT